jgi:hypothetical protein
MRSATAPKEQTNTLKIAEQKDSQDWILENRSNVFHYPTITTTTVPPQTHTQPPYLRISFLRK